MKLKIVNLIIVCFLSIQAHAAAPAVHVALGERWIGLFAPKYTVEEKKLFLLGTVFPDIRYLGVIKRQETHVKGVTLEKIYQEKSPFRRGVLLHSFVDEYRDKIVRKQNMEQYCKQIEAKHQSVFLKLVEDQIIYPQHDWSEFRGFLTTIPEEEKAYKIELKGLTEWHALLTLYFTAQPSFLLAQFSLLDQNVSTIDAPTIKSWSTLLPQYAADPKIKTYLDGMFASFEQEMKRYAKVVKP